MKLYVHEKNFRSYNEGEVIGKLFGSEEYFKEMPEDTDFENIIDKLYPEHKFEMYETNTNKCIYASFFNKYKNVYTEICIWKLGA